VFSDAARCDSHKLSVDEVRVTIRKIEGFKSVQIIERMKNYGCDASIIDGVSYVIERHKTAIIIEDDIVTSPAFLTYMNKLLIKFKNEKKVFSIGGYSPPESILKIPKDYNGDIYFHPRTCSWGWATWEDRWEKVDWNVENFEIFWKSRKIRREFDLGGEDLSKSLAASRQNNESLGNPWDIRFCYSQFTQGGLTALPTHSYVNNIGHDNTGVHCKTTSVYSHTNLNEKYNFEIMNDVVVNQKIMLSIRKFYRIDTFKVFIINIMTYLNIYKKYIKIKSYINSLVSG
jgi:hypothetical protein